MSIPLSILDAATQMQQGRLTPSELVDRCLARIGELEDQTHAWVLVDADGARAAAARLGEELARGSCRGPLHGIPIGVKDIIDVEGWPTRAGSALREGHVARQDATVVARLRAAGAVLLGKTVTTEFACFDPPPTLNPWNHARTPGGSSSGSAAALATQMCLGALGSQTGGSITRPAAYCGVAGCKPTFGRVSRAGVVPVSHHLDHVGPMGRRVADLAILLQMMAGVDPRDPMSLDQPPPDYPRGLAEVTPPRLGLIEPFFLEQADRQVKDVVLAAVEKLKAGGTAVIEMLLPAGFEHVHAMHRRIMAVEAAEFHREMYAAQRKFYGPKLSSLLEEGLATAAADYQAALEHQARFQQDVRQLFHGIDAILTPAATSTAPSIETTGDPRFNSPWSYSGVPTVTIPCGLAADGMPVGLQFIGPELSEMTLLCAAHWCESVVVSCQ